MPKTSIFRVFFFNYFYWCLGKKHNIYISISENNVFMSRRNWNHSKHLWLTVMSIYPHQQIKNELYCKYGPIILLINKIDVIFAKYISFVRYINGRTHINPKLPTALLRGSCELKDTYICRERGRAPRPIEEGRKNYGLWNRLK